MMGIKVKWVILIGHTDLFFFLFYCISIYRSSLTFEHILNSNEQLIQFYSLLFVIFNHGDDDSFIEFWELSI